MRRFVYALAALLVAGVLLGTAVGTSSLARFTSTTANSGDSFTAVSDFAAPRAARSMIEAVGGGTPGTIRQTDNFYIYAQVDDSGNPASGTASVSADASAITASASNVPLVAGSYTRGGRTYNFRSAALTPDAGSSGQFSYTLRMTDQLAQSRSQSFTGEVSDIGPALREASSANSGSTFVSTLSVPAPNPQDGDTIFAIVVSGATSAAITAPAGWTLYDEQGGSGLSARVFRKTASAEPSSYTFQASAMNRMVAGVVSYAGVTNSDQFAGALEPDGPAPATHFTPSITTTANTRLLALYTDSVIGGARSWTSADRERVDVSTTGDSAGANLSTAIYDTLIRPPGTQQRSATSTAGTKNAAAWLIALR